MYILDADYLNLARFDGPHDANYRKVVQAIQRLCHKGSSPVARTRDQNQQGEGDVPHRTLNHLRWIVVC